MTRTGLLLGLDPEATAALAIARRLRDLVIFLPGLLAWILAERRPAATLNPGLPACPRRNR